MFQDREFKARLKAKKGGVAILTALGFLVFAIPLLTGSLDLAQTTNIDARVKTGITESDIQQFSNDPRFFFLILFLRPLI